MPAAGPSAPTRAARHTASKRARAAAQAVETRRQHSLLRRARLEHASLLRGLLLFAIAALLFTVLHAGLHRAFVPGWWRQW